MNYNPFGHFRGATLIQTHDKIGGGRNVFVNLVGIHDDLVYPQFGGKVMNPPKGVARMFAGDLCEYRLKTEGAFDPEIYILRTFKVVSASGTTVNVERGEFSHKPFVGDILMKAPDTIGGEGTAITVTAVASSVVSEQNVWALTVSDTLSVVENDILVEGEANGSTNMLVKRINGVFDCDADFVHDENIGNVTDGSVNADDFYKARYLYTPAIGGQMWIEKMSPLPQCVLDINISNLDRVFRVDYRIDGKKVSNSVK